MRLKFITLNIWFGGKLWDELVAFLREENADIVALQEVYNGQDSTLSNQLRSFDALTAALPYEHRAFAPAYRDANFSNIEIGQAVFSKFPILANETIWYDIPFGKLASSGIADAEIAPRSLQHSPIRANRRMLHVFNTHGIWGSDGEDNPRRFAMVDTILRAVRGKQNVILSGDFNLKHTTQAAARLRGALHDVFGNDLVSTFNMRQKTDSRFASLVVDMLFVSPEINVLEKNCPQMDVSDHLPLVCVLEVQ